MCRSRKYKLPPLPWTVILNKQLSDVINNIDISIANLKQLCDDYKQKYETEIEKTQKEKIKLQRKIDENSEEIARLHQEVEDRDFRLSQLLNSMNENLSVKEMKHLQCQCCCEDVRENMSLKCSKGHLICKDCVNMQCRVLNNSFFDPVNQIKCCSVHDCIGCLDSGQLCQTESGQELIKEYHIQQFIPILHEYLTKFDSDEKERNIRFLKSNGAFRAFQCANCGYGPLLHAHCSDLQVHHGQKSDNGYVNNACPLCNVLADDVNDLETWDGFMLKQNELSA